MVEEPESLINNLTFEISGKYGFWCIGVDDFLEFIIVTSEKKVTMCLKEGYLIVGMTMKYKHPRKSDNLSEVLAVIFNESKRVPEIADELGTSESTIYKRLNALKRENLVESENHKYRPNKDTLYEEFWQSIIEKIRFEEEEKEENFQVVKNQIKGDREFRKHLLGFIETELQLTSTPIKEIFSKYKDRLEIRYDLVYQLRHNQIDDKGVSEQKQLFWKYLQIIQAYLPHAAWTEPVHGTALESQIYPGEEQKMDTVDDMWHELVEIADQNLENLAEVSQ